MYEWLTWFAKSELFWVEAIKVLPILFLVYWILMNLVHFARAIQIAGGDTPIHIAMYTTSFCKLAAWQIGMLTAYLIFLFR